MRNDIEFLKDSELSCIFRFSFKSDPFLVKPSMYLERNGKHLIMQDELAIIPLPNMLIKRIQYAESIIFEAMKAENSKKSTPLNTSTMILNTDYVLCKEIMGSFLNEATDAGISQILNSLKLNEKLLDKALKFITESLVNSYTKKAVKKISKSTSTDLLSFEINLDILNSEIEKCIIDIGNLEMDAQKKQISHEINRRKLLNLIDLQIAEGVFRNLFEKMIEEIDLEHLAETAVAQELDLKMSEVKNDIDIRKLLEKERKILDEKIGSVMGISIVNEFVDEEWLYGLCRNLHTKHASKINVTTAPNQMILQEPEDQAMENFTPDVHSPREYSPNEIDLQEPDTNRSVYSVFNLDFASEDDFADLSDLQIKPIFSKEHKISAIINEYYQYIPSNYRAVVPKIDQLVSLVNKGINPC